MATENTPSPNGKSTSKQHVTDAATENHNNEDINEKVKSKLYSKQPRFTTTEIIQKFPNLNNRYCQKIGFSVPWDNDDLSLNNDTYHLAIRQIFNLVKEYDPQFQLIPWNITNQNYIPIVHEKHIPSSPRELKEYVYDLHIQPKRVRAAMVVTSAFNLKEILKQQTMATTNSKTLLNKMRQAKIHMKPLNIQTLGEIKLVGFLQFIHPHYTNIKKLLIELQSILETKDITLEMYRPSAITKDNKIIDAPEALAIGAPSDISIAVYKSLLEKWKGIHKGEYDVLIGQDSLLKDGFFIPFSSNLLNRESRNRAVFAHKGFLKEYTCIHLKRCTSVDVEFTLTLEEATSMEYILNDNEEQVVTLRDIIQCWTEPDSDALLVHTIQSTSGNKKTLLVKKKFKKYITTEILRVLEILEKRKDFNKICGNSEEYGACIDKFTISRSGRSYLSSIRIPSSSQSVTFKEDLTSHDNSREKRKRQELTESSLVTSESSTTSPTHKKGNHEPSLETNNSTSPQSMTYSQAASTKSTHDSDGSKSKMSTINDNMTQLTILKQTNHKNNEIKPIQPAAESIIPFIDTSTAEITTSTLTTEDHGAITLMCSNMITKMVDQQISKITSAMTSKYETEIKTFQLAQSNQISQLHDKQKLHDNDLQELRQSQETMHKDIEKKIEDKHNDVEKKLENKVESQTTLLNSLVNLIQDMKAENDHTKKRHQAKKRIKEKKKLLSPKVSQTDLTDCSFSAGSSSQCSVSSVNSANSSSNHSNSTPEIHNHSNSIKGQTIPPESQSILLCKKHENNIITSDDDDIRRKTRSQVANTIDSSKEKWEGITSKTKHATKLHLALVSPTKQTHKGKKYDKGSPNYNQYDPSGSIVNNTKSKQKPGKDHTKDHPRVLRSGRKT